MTFKMGTLLAINCSTYSFTINRCSFFFVGGGGHITLCSWKNKSIVDEIVKSRGMLSSIRIRAEVLAVLDLCKQSLSMGRQS